jgi:hypothetical protein
MPIIIKKNITSIKEKVEIECKLYLRLNNLFGHRQSIRPTSVLQPSTYEETNNEVLEFVNEVDEQDDLGFLKLINKMNRSSGRRE